ncbi:hypothetical protein BB559_005792 [Furculomyces boomerangus]|uniref:CBM1 domain-containing protein n=2 Tax=Harpellales TaxID=61421 RepID=A0A2T9Y6K3_9FUNG|nr:hypothetical protein BB559_005792 [Furculomyces boomerangus]PVZ99520.1 hypothetical protein BB558_004544 [Smittium angustum]
MLFKQSLVLLATAVTLAISQSVENIQGYLPAGKNGNTLLVTQGQYPVPNFSKLTQSSNYNPVLYTDENIAKSGWTLDSLSFLKTMQPDTKKTKCINCDSTMRSISTLRYFSGVGTCCGGWCQYPGTYCYYNVACGYWYKCIPSPCKPVIKKPCTTTPKPRTTPCKTTPRTSCKSTPRTSCKTTPRTSSCKTSKTSSKSTSSTRSSTPTSTSRSSSTSSSSSNSYEIIPV